MALIQTTKERFTLRVSGRMQADTLVLDLRDGTGLYQMQLQFQNQHLIQARSGKQTYSQAQITEHCQQALHIPLPKLPWQTLLGARKAPTSSLKFDDFLVKYLDYEAHPPWHLPKRMHISASHWQVQLIIRQWR